MKLHFSGSSILSIVFITLFFSPAFFPSPPSTLLSPFLFQGILVCEESLGFPTIWGPGVLCEGISSQPPKHASSHELHCFEHNPLFSAWFQHPAASRVRGLRRPCLPFSNLPCLFQFPTPVPP